MSAKLLVWAAQAHTGYRGELTSETHLYFFDRYWRLAEWHQRGGRTDRARELRAKAAAHYGAAGGGGPPYAAAMAMPKPPRPIFTNAVSRTRRRDPDDAA